MQAYLAEKYMSGPKADAILSRVAPEKKKKKRKTDTAASTSAYGFGIVDEDGEWGGVSKGADEEEDDAAEAVVASDRSFKKRRVAEGEEESGWATVREGIKREDASPPPDEKPQVVETRFAGGLVRASDLKKRLPEQSSSKKSKRSEAESEREREEARLAQETIYRDASGRKIDTKTERAEAARRKRELEEKEAQKMEWGKGLVQRDDAARRAEQLEKERKHDLAVYADDMELNEEQKSTMRWNDPAAQFLTKKSKKGPRRPEYTGPPPPPNRFGIKPGYRWDGVDRSNGFEKKYFQKLNERKRRGLESYQWSVDDM